MKLTNLMSCKWLKVGQQSLRLNFVPVAFVGSTGPENTVCGNVGEKKELEGLA